MEPIVVFPPLQGEWKAITTPGDKIPSHGTHKWGMTYAYDFLRLDKNKNGIVTWHNKSLFNYFLGQVKLSDTFSWGEPIYSPVDGIVREVFNSANERSRLHIITDIGLALLNSAFFSYKRGKTHKLGGNYLIIESTDCCAFIAHAKEGSIKLKVGDSVFAGELIAEIGHSGNSTAPHLHFQLMDRVDIKSAKGLPCCFSSYDVQSENGWEKVKYGVPSSKYTIRFT